MKIFEADSEMGSLTIWRLSKQDAEPGKFYVETYGDPALTAEEFARMAETVAGAAKQPIPTQ
jgi:hypothetical protein